MSACAKRPHREGDGRVDLALEGGLVGVNCAGPGARLRGGRARGMPPRRAPPLFRC